MLWGNFLQKKILAFNDLYGVVPSVFLKGVFVRHSSESAGLRLTSGIQLRQTLWRLFDDVMKASKNILNDQIL